jgi:7-cyano-7-deazaguanine synthase in queuosine biosynthesis
MGKKVLLYSGGLDSWLIDKLWKPDVKLYVDVGSLGSKAEVPKLDEDVVIEKLDISRFELPERNYLLPLRNLYFCMLAMNYGDEICLGATASSTNLDKNETFCKLASDLLTYLSPQVYGERREVKIVVPYKQYSKTQLLKMYKKRGGDLDLAFNATSSCYNPNPDGTPCNECSSCIKKAQAFKDNGYGN